MIIAEYFNKEPFVLINAFPSPREKSEERLRGRNEVTGWDEGRLSAVDTLRHLHLFSCIIYRRTGHANFLRMNRHSNDRCEIECIQKDTSGSWSVFWKDMFLHMHVSLT